MEASFGRGLEVRTAPCPPGLYSRRSRWPLARVTKTAGISFAALVRLRNERRRIELQPSPIVGADVASLVDRRDGAADRLPRVGDAVRLGDDVHQSCELEDPSKKASWARGVAGRIKTAGGGLTSHLAPPGPFSSVFMETKTRTTTGRLSVRPA